MFVWNEEKKMILSWTMYKGKLNRKLKTKKSSFLN